MPSVVDRFHRGCELCGDYTPDDIDAANRLSEEISYHLSVKKWSTEPIEVVDRWIAIRLSDGTSDHQLYDTKADAMLFAPRALGAMPRHLLYVSIPLTGMPPSEALHLLKLWRQPFLNTTAPVEAANPFVHHPLTMPPGVRP